MTTSGDSPDPGEPSKWDVYQSLVDATRYQDERRWNLIGHFIVFQSILVGAALLSLEIWSGWLLQALFGFLGFLVSTYWLLFLRKNARYLDAVTKRRRDFQKEVSENDMPRHWNPYPNDEGQSSGPRVNWLIESLVLWFLCGWVAWALIALLMA